MAERIVHCRLLKKDLPGLDLSDPRGVTFTHPTTHRRTIFLTQFSHLRTARSTNGRPRSGLWPGSLRFREYLGFTGNHPTAFRQLLRSVPGTDN